MVLIRSLEKDNHPYELEKSELQQQEYLDFVKSDKHYSKYYDAIFILFNTGLRISEFCGLTVSDIDFKNKRI